MHIISKAPFEECARKYPNDALALHSLYRVIKERIFLHQKKCERRFLTSTILNIATNGTFWMSAGTILGLLPT